MRWPALGPPGGAGWERCRYSAAGLRVWRVAAGGAACGACAFFLLLLALTSDQKAQEQQDRDEFTGHDGFLLVLMKMMIASTSADSPAISEI